MHPDVDPRVGDRAGERDDARAPVRGLSKATAVANAAADAACPEGNDDEVGAVGDRLVRGQLGRRRAVGGGAAA